MCSYIKNIFFSGSIVCPLGRFDLCLSPDAGVVHTNMLPVCAQRDRTLLIFRIYYYVFRVQ